MSDEIEGSAAEEVRQKVHDGRRQNGDGDAGERSPDQDRKARLGMLLIWTMAHCLFPPQPFILPKGGYGYLATLRLCPYEINTMGVHYSETARSTSSSEVIPRDDL